jgi:hypothetical protein
MQEAEYFVPTPPKYKNMKDGSFIVFYIEYEGIEIPFIVLQNIKQNTKYKLATPRESCSILDHLKTSQTP